MHRSTFLFAITCLAASTALAQPPTIGKCTVLPADNIWNTAVDQLAVSANSATYVNTIGLTSAMHADFGSGTYNGGPIGIPFLNVPGAQAKYTVTFQYADESEPGPYAIPLTAPIEGGSASTGDRHAIAVDTDNCILYELYSAYPQSSSWQAGSGSIYNLLSNILRPSGWTSADAAGLPILPGLVRYDEIAAGEIRHALRFTVPRTQKAFVWPARHYASSLTDPMYPPMGVRFRLKASFDISGYSATNQIILRALKKYGMMIADNGSAWYLSGAPDSRWDNTDLHNLGKITGAAFEVVDVSSLMVNANSGQARQSTTTFVTVSPATASVLIGATRQFTATVQNATDLTVKWSVNGIAGGNSTVGLISTAGLYTAPSAVPAGGSVTVQAASNEMPSAIGAATVTITAPPPPPPPVTVTVSPATAMVKVGRAQQFVATVKNSTNTSVTWSVNGVVGGNATLGTVSTAGRFVAPASVPSPATVTVKAVSVANPQKSASAAVTILLRR